MFLTFLKSFSFKGKYVFPEIHNKWKTNRRQTIREIHQSERKTVDIAVDGQCDSPGHNATYCTVTAMDAESNKVLDFSVVNVKEVKNSQGTSCFFVHPGNYTYEMFIILTFSIIFFRNGKGRVYTYSHKTG